MVIYYDIMFEINLFNIGLYVKEYFFFCNVFFAMLHASESPSAQNTSWKSKYVAPLMTFMVHKKESIVSIKKDTISLFKGLWGYATWLGSVFKSFKDFFSNGVSSEESFDEAVVGRNPFYKGNSQKQGSDIDTIIMNNNNSELYKNTTVADFKMFLDEFFSVLLLARKKIESEKSFKGSQKLKNHELLSKIDRSFDWLYELVQKDPESYKAFIETFKWVPQEGNVYRFKNAQPTFVLTKKDITSDLLKSYAEKGYAIFRYARKSQGYKDKELQYPNIVYDFFTCLAKADRNIDFGSEECLKNIDLDLLMRQFMWKDTAISQLYNKKLALK